MAGYRRFRAPTTDGGVLADPGWDEQLALLEANRRRRAQSDVRWSGVGTAELSAATRAEVLAKASEAASTSGGRLDASAPLVVSGHQPELFHPGVLIKNLALDRLAARAGGVGLHLVIDSDLCRSASIRTPNGPIDQPTQTPVAYDAVCEATPYEERRVCEAGRFASFPAAVEQALAGLIDAPLVGEVWPSALTAVERGEGLATALSVARRRLQAEWRDRTIELPLSDLCDTVAFRTFAAELLSRCEATHAAYNAALADYRAAHRLRTPAQPLPDLAQFDDDFVETPFWVYREGAPVRRPLLARPSDDGFTLSDGAGWSANVASLDAVERLRELRTAGVKLRSRALATTLFCRWLLADLFLHGIGGAKYDQVTDAWSERLFGAAPPPHATLSATLRLPIARPATEGPSSAELLRRLRNLEYHPERFLEGDLADNGVRNQMLDGLQRKQRAIALTKTSVNAADRHREIQAANAALRKAVEPQRRAAEASLVAARARERAGLVLGSREHSFVLFPRDWLVERLTAMVPEQ